MALLKFASVDICSVNCVRLQEHFRHKANINRTIGIPINGEAKKGGCVLQIYTYISFLNKKHRANNVEFIANKAG